MGHTSQGDQIRMRLFLVLMVLSLFVSGQENKPPYWDEVQAFKKQDSASFPGTGKILFVGSSSFTYWKDVQEYFPAYPIINRGFGGSSLTDVIRYREDVIFKYKPKQVVIYCGENDLAASDTVTVNMVVVRFKQLFSLIRAKFRNVPIAYVSMKPSPSREHLMLKYESANKLIQLFLKGQRNTVFIDVYHKMLNRDGTPLRHIFLEDNLHMNEKGYAIWKKLIQPHLQK
ncbi:MAG: G-D-S-L family lipolytic protein [Chitinophagaceae bacterium]|nr:G-D-S-L family lipolytic protein [Chitinophagaceae bacterium]